MDLTDLLHILFWVFMGVLYPNTKIIFGLFLEWHRGRQ